MTFLSSSVTDFDLSVPRQQYDFRGFKLSSTLQDISGGLIDVSY